MKIATKTTVAYTLGDLDEKELMTIYRALNTALGANAPMSARQSFITSQITKSIEDIIDVTDVEDF